MRIERLPFTVYDIIGYLVPGLVFVLGITEIVAHEVTTLSLPSADKMDFLHKVVIVFAIFVGGYTAGHVIAYVSSVTIESLIYSILGYPSQYLTVTPDGDQPLCRRRITTSLARAAASLKFAVSLPIFLHVAVLICLLNAINKTWFLVKPMRKFSISILDLRFRFAFGYDRSKLSSDEWFKLIEAYVGNNNTTASHRAYNYVVLYGFLRNMALVFMFLAWASAVRISFVESAHLESVLYWATVICLIANVICVFGFAKFSRRYSQEMIMGFVMDRDLKRVWRPSDP